MKFNIDGKQMEIYVNGKKITKAAKKAKLSDKGEKLNDAMKKFLAKKEGKNETSNSGT